MSVSEELSPEDQIKKDLHRDLDEIFSQNLVMDLSETCFQKCFKKKNFTSKILLKFSKTEEECLQNCISQYEETYHHVNKTLKDKNIY
eukprot:gene11461-4625_t